jgi:hypothetical protein
LSKDLNKDMSSQLESQMELIKLVSGERLLRLSDGFSGFAIEMKLNPGLAVSRQKQALLAAFKAASAQLVPASA